MVKSDPKTNNEKSLLFLSFLSFVCSCCIFFLPLVLSFLLSLVVKERKCRKHLFFFFHSFRSLLLLTLSTLTGATPHRYLFSLKYLLIHFSWLTYLFFNLQRIDGFGVCCSFRPDIPENIMQLFFNKSILILLYNLIPTFFLNTLSCFITLFIFEN